VSESTAKPTNSFRPGVIALAVALGYVLLCGLYIEWSTHLAARWAGSVRARSLYSSQVQPTGR